MAAAANGTSALRVIAASRSNTAARSAVMTGMVRGALVGLLVAFMVVFPFRGGGGPECRPTVVLDVVVVLITRPAGGPRTAATGGVQNPAFIW